MMPTTTAVNFETSKSLDTFRSSLLCAPLAMARIGMRTVEWHGIMLVTDRVDVLSRAKALSMSCKSGVL